MSHIIFSEETKQKIFERDGHKCVMCGMGEREGEYINAWYIKPTENGGKAIVENGMTFCTKHFFMSQMHGCLDMAKLEFVQMFMKVHKEGNTELQNFSKDVIGVFSKYLS